MDGIKLSAPTRNTRIDSPLTIAMVAPSLEILGGQGVQAEELRGLLERDGHRVIFIPVNPSFPRGLKWLRRVPYLRTVLNQILYVASLPALRRADVVHVFSASYWSFLLAPVPAMLAARLFGRYTVLNYHSGEAGDHLAHWGLLVHPWLHLANEIVVPSDYLKEEFARYHYHASRVRNVVDTSRFRFRERPRIRPRLLSIRNLEPHYRVGVTIEAFALLKARYPEAELVVAGYGSEEQRLRRQVEALGVEGVRFAGRVEGPDVPALFDEADIFVNSSIVDNQPISVLEAFAAGLPVVSTGTGDIKTMVRQGETGCLVPPERPDLMAEALVTLLENPRRAAGMARRARDELDKYTWDAVRRDWAMIYTGAFN